MEKEEREERLTEEEKIRMGEIAYKKLMERKQLIENVRLKNKGINFGDFGDQNVEFGDIEFGDVEFGEPSTWNFSSSPYPTVYFEFTNKNSSQK